MKPTLYILDITGMVFRAITASPPLTNSKGVPTGGVFLFTRILLSLLDKHKPTHVCAVWDAPARSFRKDLCPEYKANRPPLDAATKLQLKLCRAVVKALPLPNLQVAGVEADDTMASLAHVALVEGFDPVIVSSDKDMMQMVGNIQMYDPQKSQWIDREAVVAKWGVEPCQVRDLLALVGDTTDNINGVDGWGEKTAAKYLKKHGFLEGIKQNCGDIKGKLGDNLRKAMEDGKLDLYHQLVTLKKDVVIPVSPKDMAMPPPDDKARTALFMALEFHSLLPSEMPDEATLRARVAVEYDAKGQKV